MAIEISDWISLAALATSYIAYMEAKKDNKSAVAVEALSEVMDASEKTHTYLLLRAKGEDGTCQ